MFAYEHHQNQIYQIVTTLQNLKALKWKPKLEIAVWDKVSNETKTWDQSSLEGTVLSSFSLSNLFVSFN